MLVVKRDYYNYFGGQKIEYKKYENLLEGWIAYKKEKASDFNYGDAFKNTTCFVYCDCTVRLKPQRYHARSRYAWEKMCEEKSEQDFRDSHMGFSEVEYDFLLSLTEFDASNEEIII